jgi:hypothetical protein
MAKPIAPLLFGKRRPVPLPLVALYTGTESERDMKV